MTLAMVGGFPRNQVNGVNNTFNPDGTNTITTGTDGVPVNWCSDAPLTGIGARYWVKFTYVSTTSGGVTTITNNNVVLSLATAQFPGATGGTGIGSANFSYNIYDDAAGTIARAFGTGNTNNTI